MKKFIRASCGKRTNRKMDVKYPFTPELIDALPEELAELFRSLEQTLLVEICSRLMIADQLNEVSVQDIRALRSHGISLEDIENAIREYTGISEKKLDELFDNVVEWNQQYYTELIDIAKVTKPQTLVDERDIDAIRRQTHNEFTNLTRSMAFVVRYGAKQLPLQPRQAYQWAVDNAVLQVQSGAISYNEAIRNAVKQLADSGIKAATYTGGRMEQIDSVVRSCVMTAVNQINAKYSEQSMEYLQTDLVEVSAHLGARNTDGPHGWENHAEWQGKVYRWKRHETKSGRNEQYDSYAANKPNQVLVGNRGESAQGSKNESATILNADVTNEYLRSATPGIGEITYDDGYEIGTHKDEIKTAKWIHEKFGGNIRLLRESGAANKKSPDYEWNGRLWETKGTHSINSADKSLQHALKQIKSNPGGVILNLLGELDTEKLVHQLSRRFLRSDLNGFDLMIIKNEKLIGVFRYKK